MKSNIFNFILIKCFVLSILCLPQSCIKNDVVADYGEYFWTTLEDTVNVSALDKDTTITFVVRSEFPWKIENSSDWCELSQKGGSSNTRLDLVVRKNNFSESRSADILFKFDDTSVKPCTLRIRQAAGARYLSIDKERFEEDYTAKRVNVNIDTNIEFEITVNKKPDSDWFSYSLDKTGAFTQSLNIDLSENKGLEARFAEIEIQAKDDETLKKTVTINQMYYVEILESSILNSATGNILSWTKSADERISSYLLTIYDKYMSPIYTEDVSSVNSCDLSQLDVFNTYVGQIYVQVSGLSANGENVVLAQSEIVEGNSHFASGDGGEDTPYEIANIRHLSNFYQMCQSNAALLNCCYRQSANITLDEGSDLNFTPIGNLSNGFSGIYDGGGFSIDNLKIISDLSFVAPFAIVAKTGIIKNLKVSVINVTGKGSASVGGLCGVNYGLVENCFVSATGNNSVIFCNTVVPNNVGNAYVGYAGGIAGGNEGIIRNSGNSCPVFSLYIAGGIAGGRHTASLDQETYIMNCYNTADIFVCPTNYSEAIPDVVYNISPRIDANGTVGASAGGIVGRLERVPTAENAPLVNKCFNSGNVYAHSNGGGVVGRVFHASVEDCYNSGKLFRSRDNGNVSLAGIVGYFAGANSYLTNCYNIGAHAVYPSNTAFVAGIAGFKEQKESRIIDVVIMKQESLPIVSGKIAENVNANVSGIVLDETHMSDLSRYPATFTSSTWIVNPAGNQSGYAYPQIIGLPHINRTGK